MPTSHTQLTVFNRALDFVAEFPITTPLDGGPYARWLNRNYAPAVESALRQQPWNFACAFYQPQQDADAPTMRWRRSYSLPNGWLRVLPPTYNGERTGRKLEHAVQGNKLLTNDAIPKGVELVMNVQNPGEWDPLFADYIAAKLAVGLAHRFTAKNSFVQQCRELANEAYEQAELINAFEGSMPQPDEYDIIWSRGSDGYYDRY